MHFAKLVLCAAALSFAAGATAASAEEAATVSSCHNLADQVRTAIDNNEQSANFDQAKRERTYGLEFCSNGFYDKGVAHYRHALSLLGVTEQTVAQKS